MKSCQHFEKAAGEHGLFTITETGICLPMDAPGIEEGCTKRYKLVALPNAAGGVMKVLDGTAGTIVSVTMLTDFQTYKCVKVHGETQPLAPPQNLAGAAPSWSGGQAVLTYRIVYQQVGDVT
jgi:hypothetical protein